jgi:predicted TPR repeat methyltransferase
MTQSMERHTSPSEEQDSMSAKAAAEFYDSEARATGWLGPEVAFGLVYEYVRPGQSILDLGIGTGLASILFRKAGLKVHGMDVSQEMLDACRWKGFDDLTRHDLTNPPYPYAAGSFDHVACIGVMSFLYDLSPVFAETARMLRTGGTFVFVTSDRTDQEDFELVVGPERTGSGEGVTMYRHSGAQIGGWTDRFGFMLLKSLQFTTYMDHDRKERMRTTCYVVTDK